ncbi:MAG: hypothetical protein MMC23_002170 [Stictis urceolatum]|nr:hypothetical protein [Stictis urceolata]
MANPDVPKTMRAAQGTYENGCAVTTTDPKWLVTADQATFVVACLLTLNLQKGWSVGDRVMAGYDYTVVREFVGAKWISSATML